MDSTWVWAQVVTTCPSFRWVICVPKYGLVSRVCPILYWQLIAIFGHGTDFIVSHNAASKCPCKTWSFYDGSDRISSLKFNFSVKKAFNRIIPKELKLHGLVTLFISRWTIITVLTRLNLDNEALMEPDLKRGIKLMWTWKGINKKHNL